MSPTEKTVSLAPIPSEPHSFTSFDFPPLFPPATQINGAVSFFPFSSAVRHRLCPLLPFPLSPKGSEIFSSEVLLQKAFAHLLLGPLHRQPFFPLEHPSETSLVPRRNPRSFPFQFPAITDSLSSFLLVHNPPPPNCTGFFFGH